MIGLIIVRRMHRCEICNEIFDCDECLDAMRNNPNDPCLYAPLHEQQQAKTEIVFKCPRCVRLFP